MSDHLNKINGVANVSFAGAWMGFGFHEDGFAAGAHVARTLIDGRGKTAPLDLVRRVEGAHTGREVTYWRHAIKVAIFAMQKLLQGVKIG